MTLNDVNSRPGPPPPPITYILAPTNELPREEVKIFQSGAKSSGRALPYDAIPFSLDNAVARRLELGMMKYTRDNWKLGLDEPEYIRDRVNHLYRHLRLIQTGDESEESLEANVDAVAWGAMFLAEAATEHNLAFRQAFEDRK